MNTMFAPPIPGPVDWSDEMLLELMAVGLRHAQYKANAGPSIMEIRQGIAAAMRLWEPVDSGTVIATNGTPT